MGRRYPAVDVRSDQPDLVLAVVDDFSPTAIEEREDALRIFFSTADARRAAAQALSNARCSVYAVEVDDEDWARRSQENLAPVTVGRIIVTPRPEPAVSSVQPLVIVIQPSMGFGTGHHATTRLCLAALQAIDVTDAEVTDVGTGSGILAIAARRLGAQRAVGIDDDPDAIQSAAENLALNPDAAPVEFRLADLTSTDLPLADVITANLTGALLVRVASALKGALNPRGILITSGLLAHERAAVVAAYSPAKVVWEQAEDEWIGLALRVVR